jgi:hypothetical protein
VIVSGNMKVLISPRKTPPNLMDCAIEPFGVAIDDSKRFAVFTPFCEFGLKRREPGILAQFCNLHLVEAAYPATGHFRGTMQINNEFLIGTPEVQYIVFTVVSGAEGHIQVARREEDGASAFNDERISYVSRIPPHLDLSPGLISNNHERNPFFPNSVEHGNGGFPQAIGGIDQHTIKIAENNLHGSS